MNTIRKALILTVGYGHGHYSAAKALEDGFIARGIKARVEDPCEADATGLYTLTKAYYKMCVRRMPWLWAMAYSQTETADWHNKVNWPLIRRATMHLADLIFSWKPDVVVCTYPLFAYMLDFFRQHFGCDVPYAVVVTDALEISKPWVKSHFDMLFVPDEYSREKLLDRYGLRPSRVFDAGFPVKKQFLSVSHKNVPDFQHLNVLYGVHINPARAVRQIRSIVETFPFSRVVVLAGPHQRYLMRKLKGLLIDRRLLVLDSSDKMHELLKEAHVYIGKVGAATMFECYACGVPMLANYALPGQEQGNLELLLLDECGLWVGGSDDICYTLSQLMSQGACLWQRMRNNMLAARKRSNGSLLIVDKILEKLNNGNGKSGIVD